MQTIVMTEMLRATARFAPNGRPIYLDEKQRRMFLREMKDGQPCKAGKVLRILGTVLVQFLNEVHVHPYALRQAD